MDINQRIALAYRSMPQVQPGFTGRESQKTMIAGCLRVFRNSQIGLCQAPTGTGKSTAYLLPGILWAAESDRVLVISTATRSLQDQLVAKDIPTALKACALVGVSDVKVAVLKGRERHVCPIKLYAKDEQPDLFRPGSGEVIGKLKKAFDSGEWNGIRDTLDNPVPSIQWNEIANTAAGCSGESCPSYDECPYYLNVEKAKAARVIVVNHDYLLTLFSKVSNHLFSDPDRYLYVFDEGHHLPDKILSSFAHSLDMMHPWEEEFRHINELLGKRSQALKIALARTQTLWSAASKSTDNMLGDGTIHRFVLGEPPQQFLDLLSDLQAALKEVTEEIASAQKAISDQKKRGFADLVLARAAESTARIRESILCIEAFSSAQPMARWLERSRRSLEIRCSPFDSGALARKHLWPNIKGALIASATLNVSGSFASSRRELGLPDETPCLDLKSPFDYSKSKLVVPQNAREGTDKSHTRAVQEILGAAALNPTELGTIVYFTSRRQMMSVYESFTPQQRSIVLMQGDLSVWQLVSEHKRRIDAGEPSVIFGLDSISEGVDLPGAYCTQVFISRLPFPSPDEPVFATHSEYLKQRGVDPFNTLSVPCATRKFMQVVGRLVRTSHDRGVVYVLDARLRTKAYGKAMAKSVPLPFVSG